MLGSTVLITGVEGDVIAQYQYDPFGNVIGYGGSADTNYTFTGQEYDAETDQYYFSARYHNANNGRFFSRDTYLGNDGDILSQNRYIYTKNNPLKYTDPTGNEEQSIFDTSPVAGVSIAVYNPNIEKIFKFAYNEAIVKNVNVLKGGVINFFDGDGGEDYQGLIEKFLYNLDSETRIKTAIQYFDKAGYNLAAEFLRQSHAKRTNTLYRIDLSRRLRNATDDKISSSKAINDIIYRNIDESTKKSQDFFRTIGDDLAFQKNDDRDLFYALHNANYLIQGKRKKRLSIKYWEIDITISDIYDFSRGKSDTSMGRILNMFYDDQRKGNLANYPIVYSFKYNIRE